ncbi:fatty acid synthase alpha subunit Lsd1, partial [Coemansia brasiliensis]
MFIRDMSTILSQPRDKREALLLARKDEIISRLNRDYMRPWFGKKADGQVVDLEDMTYTEVIARAVELMYVKHQQRWTHPSYFQFVAKFADRAERRICTHLLRKTISAELLDVDPLDMAAFVAKQYPEAATQLLASEDVQFFISMCKQRGQKPLPFVPVLDNDFGVLLLKNVTNQSEHLDSVVDQDPQRVCIQHGPVAAQYSTIVNEPVKDILDGIYHGHIDSLVESLYNGDKDSIPAVEYIGADPVAVAVPTSVSVSESEAERVFELPAKEEQLPELELWLQMLAGLRKSWLHALLSTPVIVQENNRYAENYVRRLLRPRPERTVTIQLEDNSLFITDRAGVQELMLKYNSANCTIHLTIYHIAPTGVVVPFLLEFSYFPEQPLTPIHESKQRNDEAARQLCIDTWVASSDHPVGFDDINDATGVIKSEFTITENHVRAFCKSVDNQSWQYAFAKDGILLAPMEFTHVSFMRTLLQILNSTVFGVGQVNILHLYNEFKFEDDAPMLRANDQMCSISFVDGLVNLNPGKKLTIRSDVFSGGRKVGTLDSAFLSRSHYINPSRGFKRDRQQHFKIVLPSDADVTVLEAKEWFIYHESSSGQLIPNVPFEFCLDSEYRFKNNDTYASIITTGTVTKGGQSKPIAAVDFRWGVAMKNPVIEFLSRYQVASDNYLFANGGYSLVTAANSQLSQAAVPDTNWDYARESLDCNPFHLNPYVADFAGLPGTITH